MTVLKFENKELNCCW